MNDRRRTPARCLATLSFAGAALTGCHSIVGQPNDIDGKDHTAVFPTLRGIYTVSAPRVGAATRSHFEHTIEVDVTGTAGDFDRRGTTGGTDYRMIHTSVAYRPGYFLGPVQLHGLFGIGVDVVDLAVDSTLRSESVSDTSVGPLVGGDVRFRALDWLHPYARLAGQIGTNNSYSSHLEAGLAFTPSANVEVLLAFRQWHAKYGGHSGSFGGIVGGFDGAWDGVTVGLLMRL